MTGDGAPIQCLQLVVGNDDRIMLDVQARGWAPYPIHDSRVVCAMPQEKVNPKP